MSDVTFRITIESPDGEKYSSTFAWDRTLLTVLLDDWAAKERGLSPEAYEAQLGSEIKASIQEVLGTAGADRDQFLIAALGFAFLQAGRSTVGDLRGDRIEYFDVRILPAVQRGNEHRFDCWWNARQPITELELANTVH